ncbi:MAG: DUF349 domain-containing protein [Bacteroidales bacterium]|nr:DUF349 domain-containing protein [Bacteroidales bacterium]
MKNNDEMNPRPGQTEGSAGEGHLAKDRAELEKMSEKTADEGQPDQKPEGEDLMEEPAAAQPSGDPDPEPVVAAKPDEHQEPSEEQPAEDTEASAPEELPEEPPVKTSEEKPEVTEEPATGAVEETLVTAEAGTEGEATPDDSASPSTEQAPQQEEESEDSETLTEKYGAMNRDSLVVTLEALVEHDDVNYIRKHIGFIKVAYRKLLREENLAAYEQKLSKDKADAAEEELPADPLTERFEQAFSVYKQKKSTWDKAQEQEMHDNLGIKEAILEDLRQLIESEEELKKTYDQFNELQERWRAVGPVPRGSKATLWNNYHFLVEKFFDKVMINKELKDLDLKKNLEAKTHLCEKAEELLLDTSITRSFQQLQKLHEAWKETGPVPKDKKDEIWERFRAATEKLNKRRQEHYDSLKEEQNKNYAAKLVLCEKAEELLSAVPETPRQWQQKTEKINELFNVWKTIGYAPKKVNNEIWNRFRGALDAFFASKKEYFKQFKDKQRDNYNQKLNLCLQAEALKESEDWKTTTEALINLQNEWKKIGPVPAKFSDKIWKRFRQACDHFFHKKADHFSNVGDKQQQNLKDKLALIEQINTFDYSEDNKENLEVLKEFQRKWMEIGHVPLKHKEKLQAEFRKAIDHQFDVLNISKKVKSTLSFRTKIENIKNIQNADAIIQKERNFISNRIRTLESDIKVLENNIGFFASSKKADLLKAEFEEKIENSRNEIALLKEKMKILRES